MDSVAFSRFLEARRQEGRDVFFVVGGRSGWSWTAPITACRWVR